MRIGLIVFSPEELAGLTTYHPGGNRVSSGKTGKLLLYGGAGRTHPDIGYHLSDGRIVCLYRERSMYDAVYIGALERLEKFKENLTNRAKHQKARLPPTFSELDTKVSEKLIKQISEADLSKLVREFVSKYETDINKIRHCLGIA